jgi:hypothetical protein
MCVEFMVRGDETELLALTNVLTGLTPTEPNRQQLDEKQSSLQQFS